MQNMLLGLTQYFFNFDDPFSIARSVGLWVAIAFIAVVIIINAATKDEEKRKPANKVLLIIGGCLVCAAIIVYTVFDSIDHNADGITSLTFYPLIAVAICVLISSLLWAFKPSKTTKIVSILLILLSIIALMVCMIIYYVSGEASDKNYLDKTDVNTLGLWLGALGLLIFMPILAMIFDKRKLTFDAKTLAYGGIFIALSFALSYVRLFRMPMGGSITLASLLPIMLFSYMFGAKKGVVLGLVAGMLQAIQDHWIIHAGQFLLDYLIAFMAAGTAGIFKDIIKKDVRLAFTAGGVVAAVLRFCSHFFSGWFAFGVYASSYGMSSAPLYSLVYTSSYVFPDALISVVAGVLLMSSRSFLKAMQNASLSVRDKKKVEDDEMVEGLSQVEVNSNIEKGE